MFNGDWLGLLVGKWFGDSSAPPEPPAGGGSDWTGLDALPDYRREDEEIMAIIMAFMGVINGR